MSEESRAMNGAGETPSLREDLEAAWDRMTAEAIAAGVADAVEDDADYDDTDDAEFDDVDTDDVDTEYVGDADLADGFEREDDEPVEAFDTASDEDDSPLRHWPAEWRDRFEALPEDAQSYVLDLHGLYEQAHAEQSRAADAHIAVDAALAPYREAIHARGLTEAQAVERLLAAQAMLDRDPVGGLAMIARSYGLDGTAAAGSVSEPDTRLRALEAGQATLIQTIDRAAAERRQAAEIAAMEDALRQRVSATDEDGNPLFPYFDALRPQITALMQTGAAPSLEAAYEQAVWGHPTLRAEALRARDAEAARAREATRRAEVAKARRAGRTVHGGTEPALSTLPRARTHREELERVWDQMAAE